MKKLFAIIMAVAMIASVMVFTANAADNEWEVYASVGKYKDEYEKESDMPKEPGMKYTEAGVQVYTATHEQLEAMNANAWCGLQLKEKVNLKDGFSMTAIVDRYTENSSTDQWIAFCLWTQPKATPADTEHGTGWFCLIRPNMGQTLSFIDTATNLKTTAPINSDVFDGGALVLDVKNEDGKLVIYVNDQDMKATGFDKDFENNECYASIVGHQGNRDEIAITVTEVNGVKPTGTDAKDPFIPSDIEVPVEGPEVAANEPCWLWNAENVTDGKPGDAMKSVENEDGSLHITFEDSTAPLFNCSVKKYLYDAQQFPILAIKFKSLDDIADSSMLWYCAGDVYAAQEDSKYPLSWADCDYEDEEGWKILTVDLSSEDTWNGNIHGFRLDVASDTHLGGEEFDLMWFGFFRTEKEAYTYAGFADLYAKLYEKTAVTETEEVTDSGEATPTETTADTTNETEGGSETTENTTADDTTAETKPVDDKKDNGGLPTGAIIGIIAGVAVIAVVVVIVIVTSKKKKA